MLTDKEIRSVQKTSLKTVNTSQFPLNGYRVTHCLYQTEDINRSVSVSITETDPDDPQKYRIKSLWDKMFAKKSGDKEEREEIDENSQRSKLADAEDEDKQQSVKTKKLNGLGKGSYWITSESGGSLYVLVDERIVRISVGGRDDLLRKLQSSKAVARLVLARLSQKSK